MTEPLPVVDLAAVVAAQQDQIDDLTAVVERQQQTLDELVQVLHAGRPDTTLPAGGRDGTGLR